MRTYVKTRISEAFWFDPSSKAASDWIRPATIRSLLDPTSLKEDKDNQLGISWLDCLLKGGIFLPETPKDEPRAITILLTGPPGAGKSTLAMELCYRWSLNENWLALYITSESHEPWMIEKAKSLGWDKAKEVFEGDGVHSPNIPVVPMDKFFNPTTWSVPQEQKLHLTRGIFERLATLFYEDEASDTEKAGHIAKIAHELPETDSQAAQVLVLDSLNTVFEKNRRVELFNEFQNLVLTKGPRILIIVLDSAPSGEAADFWEFISDIVIRLDRNYQLGYMVRTLEIVKARYQRHVWGVHQLKIYEPGQLDKEPDETEDDYKSRLSRAHPYRREGGVFIFPSIHYVLSAYKRRNLKEEGNIETGVPGLEKLLPYGYPKSRCTALLGNRGGHKSHLGYLELLHRIRSNRTAAQPNHKGLIISLRDDEGTTRATMQKILNEQWDDEMNLSQFEESGHLEIMYFPPGNITPEEFFHRVLLSVQRLKQSADQSHVTVLFNSLDQLSSRFPLCAKQGIFILGIIQMLTAEAVSSFFVAAREPGQETGEYYGVDAMAELILNFEREVHRKTDYVAYATEHLHYLKEKKRIRKGWSERKVERAKAAVQDERAVVVTEVVRFAGGRAAGAKGILELIDADDSLCPLYGDRPGLHFLGIRT